MATRPEGIKEIASFLGDTPVAIENHARSLNAAPSPYSTAIGRGNRNVDLGPEWIAAVYLAALRNDPKTAAVKVPELGELKCRFTQFVHYPAAASAERDATMLESVEKRQKPTSVSSAEGNTLFTLITHLISAAGYWAASPLHATGDAPPCPITRDFRINVTISPTPRAVASFLVYDEIVDPAGELREEEHYLPEYQQADLVDENKASPFERTAVISSVHILRLGKIYAHTLARTRLREQQQMALSAADNTNHSANNKEADDLPGSSASFETLSRNAPGTTTGTAHKDSLTSSYPSACVRVQSRGIAPKGRSHEHASHHHAVL